MTPGIPVKVSRVNQARNQHEASGKQSKSRAEEHRVM
jgi:hypothetical protein